MTTSPDCRYQAATAMLSRHQRLRVSDLNAREAFGIHVLLLLLSCLSPGASVGISGARSSDYK